MLAESDISRETLADTRFPISQRLFFRHASFYDFFCLPLSGVSPPSVFFYCFRFLTGSRESRREEKAFGDEEGGGRNDHLIQLSTPDQKLIFLGSFLFIPEEDFYASHLLISGQ